jgi:nicotinate-nucleotide adenylyltransferase
VKLGLMGGMFDPIHFGHLRAAENAREALGLDRVTFVPAAVPPHRAAPAASAIDRYTMVALATANHSAFVPWDGEIRRDGPSYTVDTAEALLGENPGATLTLIVGADNLALLPQWREPARLLALCTVAVVGRPPRRGHDAENERGRIHFGGADDEAVQAADGLDPSRFVHVEGSHLPIASSALRERVRAGRSVRYLVPDAVAGYIEKRGLYR